MVGLTETPLRPIDSSSGPIAIFPKEAFPLRARRLFPFLLAAALLLPAISLAAGESCTCGDFRYVILEDGSACLVQYLGNAAEVFIPAELDGRPVTAVRGNPFVSMYDFSYHVKDCAVAVAADHPYLEMVNGVLFGRTDHRLIWVPRALGLETYDVPDGVEIIGRHAFYACKALTAVRLPESVTVIENHAFRACQGLAAVNLPEGVTSVGECAFMGCRSLESLALPASLAGIGWKAFDACPALTLTVAPGSFAHRYCGENGLAFVVAEEEP